MQRLILKDLIDFSKEPFANVSSSISKSSCKPSQNLAEFPKYLLNLKAVSAVILRLPFTISDTSQLKLKHDNLFILHDEKDKKHVYNNNLLPLFSDSII